MGNLTFGSNLDKNKVKTEIDIRQGQASIKIIINLGTIYNQGSES